MTYGTTTYGSLPHYYHFLAFLYPPGAFQPLTRVSEAFQAPCEAFLAPSEALPAPSETHASCSEVLPTSYEALPALTFATVRNKFP